MSGTSLRRKVVMVPFTQNPAVSVLDVGATQAKCAQALRNVSFRLSRRKRQAAIGSTPCCHVLSNSAETDVNVATETARRSAKMPSSWSAAPWPSRSASVFALGKYLSGWRRSAATTSVGNQTTSKIRRGDIASSVSCGQAHTLSQPAAAKKFECEAE
eukprot:3140995-Pleurochrysis_carterae.AAC.10